MLERRWWTPPGRMATWPRSGGSHEHMAPPGDIFGVGLGHPSTKLLGSVGKALCLAAGHTTDGRVLRSAARYSIGGRGIEHSTQYTVLSIQYTAHYTEYTIHRTQYTVHNVQYTIHSIEALWRPKETHFGHPSHTYPAPLTAPITVLTCAQLAVRTTRTFGIECVYSVLCTVYSGLCTVNCGL